MELTQRASETMKRTVFIIGAGASTDFQLPLGSQLGEQIRQQLTAELHEFGGGSIVRGAIQYGGEGNFSGAAQDIAGALTTALSIDRLMHSRRDRPLVEAVGKAAIAFQLGRSEFGSPLARALGGEWHARQDALGLVRQSWLSKLFALLSNGVAPERSDELFSSVSFLTFNYDRCIEWYLWLSLQHMMDRSKEEAAAIIKKIPIVHVYGSLGRLPELNQNQADTVPFGMVDDIIPVSARQIKTFTESVESDVADQIRNLISSAEAIVFLGFAFDPLNVQVLFPEPLKESQLVLGTSMDVAEPTMRNFREKAGFGINVWANRASEFMDVVEARSQLGLS